ncbi:MAG: hypothetical protein EBX41_00645 [Chitinophagia bacterium]|nr:hypothetical protein [Chitinophagia bacterium]
MPDFNDYKGNYFPINQFIVDEWKNHANDPIVFKKTVTLNGKADSTFENALQVDWKSVLPYFIKTDISDPKYLGHYKYYQYQDENDGLFNMMYIAIDEDAYTQKLLVTADSRTKRIKGIYIETDEEGLMNKVHQKLMYIPAKVIQIQRYETPLMGKKKSIRIQYHAVSQ